MSLYKTLYNYEAADIGNRTPIIRLFEFGSFLLMAAFIVYLDSIEAGEILLFGVTLCFVGVIIASSFMKYDLR